MKLTSLERAKEFAKREARGPDAYGQYVRALAAEFAEVERVANSVPSDITNAEAAAMERDGWRSVCEQLAMYRDIFAEITAKAVPCEYSGDASNRIVAYRIPVGPIHRAAGKIGFQMFDGEKYLAAAVDDLRRCRAALRALVDSPNYPCAARDAALVLAHSVLARRIEAAPAGETALAGSTEGESLTRRGAP